METPYMDIFSEIFDTYQELENTVVQDHIDKLRELDAFLPPSMSYFMVSNTTKQSYEFVSKNVKHALGLDPDRMVLEGFSYVFPRIHPEDIPTWMMAMQEAMDFTMELISEEDREKLSYSWNLRLRNTKEEYKMVYENLSPIYFDEVGKPLIGLVHSTVFELNTRRPFILTIRKLNENKEYETIYRKNFGQKLLTHDLSNREQDVLRLLARQLSSKEIAEALFISRHTVDVHRRNILKKFDFKSTDQMVQYCLDNQLI